MVLKNGTGPLLLSQPAGRKNAHILWCTHISQSTSKQAACHTVCLLLFAVADANILLIEVSVPMPRGWKRLQPRLGEAGMVTLVHEAGVALTWVDWHVHAQQVGLQQLLTAAFVLDCKSDMVQGFRIEFRRVNFLHRFEAICIIIFC